MRERSVRSRACVPRTARRRSSGPASSCWSRPRWELWSRSPRGRRDAHWEASSLTGSFARSGETATTATPPSRGRMASDAALVRAQAPSAACPWEQQRSRLHGEATLLGPSLSSPARPYRLAPKPVAGAGGVGTTASRRGGVSPAPVARVEAPPSDRRKQQRPRQRSTCEFASARRPRESSRSREPSR